MRCRRQYHCASDLDAPRGTTNFFAVVGEETMWPLARGRKQSEVTDGDAILIVEATGLDILWLEPRDLDFKTMDYHINGEAGRAIGSHHRGGAMTWSLGQRGPWLPTSTPPEKVRGLLTVAGGEPIEERW